MIQDLILPLLTTGLASNSKYSKLNRLNGIEWIFNLQTFMFCYKNPLKIKESSVLELKKIFHFTFTSQDL